MFCNTCTGGRGWCVLAGTRGGLREECVSEIVMRASPRSAVSKGDGSGGDGGSFRVCEDCCELSGSGKSWGVEDEAGGVVGVCDDSGFCAARLARCFSFSSSLSR